MRFSIQVNKDILKISVHFDSQMIVITVVAAVVFMIIVTVACFIFILRRRRRKPGEVKIYNLF
jgi:heme/copper-type cytochrome/quinol oxidase subunit 2